MALRVVSKSMHSLRTTDAHIVHVNRLRAKGRRQTGLPLPQQHHAPRLAYGFAARVRIGQPPGIHPLRQQLAPQPPVPAPAGVGGGEDPPAVAVEDL